MSPVAIIAIGAGYLVFLGLLLFIVQSKNRTQRVARIALSVGLPLTDNVEPMVRRTLRLGFRTGFISIAIGVVLATACILLGHVDAPLQIFWVDFTGVMGGIGFGSALGIFTGENNRQKGSIRVARLKAVSLSDYRSPFEQWAPRLVVAIALIGLAIRGAIYPHGYASVPLFLWIYAAVMLSSLALYEVASSGLIKNGQPANSELDLAWDDALKSRALAAIAAAPLYLGGYFGLAAWVFFPPTHTGATALGSQIEIDIQFVGIVLAIVSIGTSAARQQRYLRRLWPELAAATARPVESAQR